MTCCIEDAVRKAIIGLEGSPIKDKNVFLVARIGADEETPYCVIQVTTQQTIATGDGAFRKHLVSLQAFFLSDRVSDALTFKGLTEDWLYGSNCVTLGDCGCLCIQSRGDSKIVPQSDGKFRYEVSFSGTYRQSAGS